MPAWIHLGWNAKSGWLNAVNEFPTHDTRSGLQIDIEVTATPKRGIATVIADSVRKVGTLLQ
jgi:hypothetical protein